MKTKVTLKRFNIQLDGKNYNVFSIVKVGDIVGKNTLIGKMGKTGRASGPHLHFEIRIYTKTDGIIKENPRKYIAF